MWFGQYISLIILQPYMLQLGNNISNTPPHNMIFNWVVLIFQGALGQGKVKNHIYILSPNMFLIILLFPLPLVSTSSYLSQNIWTKTLKLWSEIMHPTVLKIYLLKTCEIYKLFPLTLEIYFLIRPILYPFQLSFIPLRLKLIQHEQIIKLIQLFSFISLVFIKIVILNPSRHISELYFGSNKRWYSNTYQITLFSS